MDLPTYFADFIRNIRPTAIQQADAIRAHSTLRQHLLADRDLDRYIIATFLQGSYRRSTDIKPVGDEKSDVDIIVVTNMDKQQFPDGARALEEFRPFLDTHYSGRYEPQSHSWGIVDGEVELDLVPTSAPLEAIRHEFSKLRESQAAVEPGLRTFGELRKALSFKEAAAAQGDQWKDEPLEIPDRNRRLWERTHPLAQIVWTSEKNNECNGHYVGVVRAFKWWWIQAAGKVNPKSYVLEAIVGACCPDGIGSIAEGVTLTAERIAEEYAGDVALSQVPTLEDHGIPENNVLERLTFAEFGPFYSAVSTLASRARRALSAIDRAESIRLWRSIFGDEFPGDGDDGNGGEYSPPPRPAEPRRERFA